MAVLMQPLPAANPNTPKQAKRQMSRGWTRKSAGRHASRASVRTNQEPAAASCASVSGGNWRVMLRAATAEVPQKSVAPMMRA